MLKSFDHFQYVKSVDYFVFIAFVWINYLYLNQIIFDCLSFPAVSGYLDSRPLSRRLVVAKEKTYYGYVLKISAAISSQRMSITACEL